MNYPFYEIFSECKILNGAEDLIISEVSIKKEAREMTVTALFPHPGAFSAADDLASEIAGQYGMNRVTFRPRFPEETLFPHGVKLAMTCAADGVAGASALLEGCEPQCDISGVTLQLKSGGVEFLRGWARTVETLLYDWYGKTVPLRLENGCDAEQVSERNEKMRGEAVREEIIKSPAKVKKREQDKSNIIVGRRIQDDFLPMREISLELGKVSVCGEVFAADHRELKKNNAVIVSFDMTDGTGSVRVNGYMDAEKAKPILERVTVGSYIAVEGKLSFSKFENDTVLYPDSVNDWKRPEGRFDHAEEKRVELHLHTRMSSMDSVVGAADIVKRAAAWGHRAVAITDHGVVQAFPEAMNAADKLNKGKPPEEQIKVLYGVECYYIDDLERVMSVFGRDNSPLDGEFVAFDLETTGLSSARDEIIEIGAVRFKNGEIIESFNTFVDPGRPIPKKITELTGIDDGMVAGAPKLREAVEAFLAFAGSSILAAHNASFDIGFIRTACARLALPFGSTYIDTRNMARAMLHNVTKFDLSTVAAETSAPAFNHHRASDDAAVVAHIINTFFSRMKNDGITDIREVNHYLAGQVRANAVGGSSNHMILLCKDETGLRNLYELISLSHLQYYRRTPVIPRSELDRHREGLLVGSACESGELFRAMVAGKSDEELELLASYYDYLEIQPIGNNAFLIREGKARGEEDLRAYNKKIVALGEKLGIPVAATCDVHFTEPGDSIYRAILMAGKGFADADQQAPLYFRTTEEMLSEFDYLGAEKAREVVITVPNRLADLCGDVHPVRAGTFAPDIEGSAEQLQSIVGENLRRYYGDNPSLVVTERLDAEMGSIMKHHFDNLYIIAQRLVSKSVSDGYLVGSRGSVGSSFAAFLAGITEVNSLPPHFRCPNCKHHDFDVPPEATTGAELPEKNCPVCGTKYIGDGFDIPFATFLGFDGDKKPDIDLNFSGEYQARAHRQTVELFGEGYVFRAGTIGTLADKTAYGFVKKYMEERGRPISRAEENRLIQGIVGVKRTTGQHPGGLIVVPKTNSIYEFTPVQHPADDVKSDIITTHFDYHSIEENLLKLDLLGHDDPTMIKMLQDLTGVDPQTIPIDDKATMSLFTTTKALGFENDKICGATGTFAVPEFGTKFVREMLVNTKPTTLGELLRISGLSHGTDVWLGNAQDIINSGKGTLSDIIACRDDIMLYLISKGVDRKESFLIMESVRKGKGIKDDQESEMRAKGVPDWYIDSCKKIKYLFPKAHAAAYVLMALRIAWYKVHHPKAFYAAYFTIRAKTFDAAVMCDGIDTAERKLKEIEANPAAKAVEKDMATTLEVVYEFYRRGFTFEKIDLYRSDATKFVITETGLLPPFTALPGLGEAAANDIVGERTRGTFISAEDISLRCPKASKTVIELLEAHGTLDNLPKNSQLSLFG